MKWIFAILAFVSLQARAADPVLEIVSGQQRLTLSQSQLLARRDAITVSVPESDYKLRYTRFRAIPIASLFKDVTIPASAVVQFRSTDGFSAVLEKSRLFNADPKASRAFLAIEDPKSPWPPLPGKAASAGPFYLVWTNPKASSVSSEEWPYQIASFTIVTDAHALFQHIYPADDAPAAIHHGFISFQTNCFPCHKMNGNGAGSIGPDLNLPMNPTEYLQSSALKALIRNPASVRTWPQRVMSGFSAAALPDAELDDLVAYLGYMSKRKAVVPP